ncbi:MAG: chemotaxis protein CheA [Thermodesulfobacteriota bacterium]
MEDLREFVDEFVAEARDMLEELEPVIVGFADRLREGDTDPDGLDDEFNRTFRLFHSIKGGAGFLQFANIVGVAHGAESLLDRLRNREIPLALEHTDLFCKALDFMKQALAHVETHGEDRSLAEQAQRVTDLFRNAPGPVRGDHGAVPPEVALAQAVEDFIHEGKVGLLDIEINLIKLGMARDDREVLWHLLEKYRWMADEAARLGFEEIARLCGKTVVLLSALRDHAATDSGEAVAAMVAQLAVLRTALNNVGAIRDARILGLTSLLADLDRIVPVDYLPEAESEDGEDSGLLGDILVRRGDVTRKEIEEAVAAQNRRIGELLVDKGAVSAEQVARAVAAQEKSRPAGEKKDEGRRQDIRVDLDKLDNLINLIGEIVIAENMVLHNPDLDGLDLANFSKAGQHMAKIIRELQEMAMTIRMIPVSGLFRRMMRLVHDLSRKSGKKVQLELLGESTEVDKTVIEKVTDPLVHLIRNAMDHGFEEPAERLRAGKGETGHLRLAAAHEEGHVLITIRDDGRGLSREKILDKAREKGLLEGNGDRMSDQEVFELVFLPGFSTADRVTDISGRGVGMDVVRRNLEEIKGRIEIQSAAGAGTTINLRIPLTMAIIDGMLIRVGESHYILPILSLQESFRPQPESITVTPGGQELVRVRNSLLPVLRLHALHGVEPDQRELDRGILIVLESGRKSICLFADELLGQQQTVIKGLSEYISRMGSVTAVSGCTILGNGEVCLILDVQSLTGLV